MLKSGCNIVGNLLVEALCDGGDRDGHLVRLVEQLDRLQSSPSRPRPGRYLRRAAETRSMGHLSRESLVLRLGGGDFGRAVSPHRVPKCDRTTQLGPFPPLLLRNKSGLPHARTLLRSQFQVKLGI